MLILPSMVSRSSGLECLLAFLSAYDGPEMLGLPLGRIAEHSGFDDLISSGGMQLRSSHYPSAYIVDMKVSDSLPIRPIASDFIAHFDIQSPVLTR